MKTRKSNKGKNQISRHYMTRIRQFGDYLASRDGGWFCFYCHIPLIRANKVPSGFAQATIDHKQALANGGPDIVANMVLACQKCNHEKGVQDFDQFYTQTAQRRQTPRPEYQGTYPFAEE